ncbi:50S ribosomal protein L3 [Candidatus Microgenomates bacterium]|nr:50S ribosomal protein L3 [Candidatus Microgenomates bacterium]
MIDAIIGTKINQSRTFTPEGEVMPVTYIRTGDCHVVSVKTMENDGYNALQLGLGTRRINLFTKPEQGHLKKAGFEKNPPRFLLEIRINTDSEQISTDTDITNNLPKIGQLLKAEDVFKVGDVVQVTGTSKGKGFAGVVKRHHFKGGPRTHGQSDRERAPGSIGQTTTPGRVYKGKRMAGRMGNQKTTIKNLKVVAIDAEKNILTVSGVVPGGRNSRLIIRKMK